MKKLLALVLALVMSMSLVTISNAAFDDADEIDYTEAVEVLNAVGVLAGSDGKFNPKAELNRAEACKIIAYLDLGGKTADAIKGSGTVFTDVAANAWYAGYVEYCAGAGYVSGVGAGKFDPTAKVTGIQFAKMLLCALGYKAETEGYNGSDWSLAIARDANKIDLFDGLSIVTSANLTREQAAQMAMNALVATCVEYKGGTNVSTSDGTTVTVNAERKEVEDNGYCYLCQGDGCSDDSCDTMQLCEKLYKGDFYQDTGRDAFGRPGTEWFYEDESVGVYGDSARYVLVLDDDYSEINTVAGLLAELQDLTDNDKLELDEIANVKVYLNGVNKSGAKNDDALAALKPGTVLEVFVKSGDKNVITDLVAYYYTVDQITDVDTDVSAADKKDDITAYLTFDSFGDIDDVDITGYNAKTFVEDAWVAYVANDKNEMIEAYVVETVEGSIATKKGTDYVTVDGTKYSVADIAADYVEKSLTVGSDATYALLLDKNNYVIGFDEIESVTKLDEVYYVDQVWAESSSKYNDTTYSYYAQLVALDGTVKEVQLEAKDHDIGDEINDLSEKDYDFEDLQGIFVTISDKKHADSTANNDKYNLTLYTGADKYDIDDSLTFGQFKKDTTRMTIGKDTYRFNSKTEYILLGETGADLKVTVKTGGVALTKDNTGVIITEKDKSVALYVLVIDTKNKITEGNTFDASDLIYIEEASTVKGDGYRVQEVYTAEGKLVEWKVAESEYTKDGLAGFYTYDTDDDGYIVLDTDDVNTLTIVAEDHVWDDEEGVLVDATYGSLYNSLLTVTAGEESTKYIDIDVASVKFVDLHETDTDKVENTYDRTVGSLKALDNILDKTYTVEESKKAYVATIDMSVSEDGAIVIFLTDLTLKTVEEA